ncbi:ATP-binding cassette domain-containing protein [Kroppenstedtia pulmonis]|uniref:ATP-binding cassette domain-containing protein n=1 Tax=Kroppenstedtia pulmonis TaxID=1380685 RepID=A0A7D3XLQ2_9BACL|nr:ABC transporter transmembrane domain-containing protein [Kroppenstedtia pulmonis]QKG83889.1 ATP-binding cassette domain-containing protein [Kroppenstedtia pulmonis]
MEIRRLLSYLKPHRKLLVLAFIVLLLATVADIAGPLLVKIFIDDYLTPGILETKPLVWLAGIYLFLHFASVGLLYYQEYTFYRIALWVVQQLRIDVFAKVQHLGLSFFDRMPGGGLISRITNDTEAVKELFVSVLSSFVQNTVMVVGILVAMFWLDAKLGFFCLLLMPLLIGIMQLYRRLSYKVYQVIRSKLAQLNANLSESIQGMSVIQALRQQDRLRREFDKINGEHYEANMRNMKLNGLLLRPAVDLIYLIALMVVLSFFGWEARDSAIQIGVLYAFINYLERMFEPFNQMMQQLTFMQQSVVSAGRVFELLDEKEGAPAQEGTENPQIKEGRIVFDQVTFSYDGRKSVLKDISFTVEPGQTVALVGHTGSGKTSIINLLMRFYPLKQGQITIDGQPLSAYSDRELRSRMGLVLQDPFLFVGNVKDNIRLKNDAISDEDVQEAARFVQADTFIEKLPQGYEEPVGERGATFSGGQRQLLSFARTMALKPKVLLLDEATASVDTETEEKIQEALKKMRKGRTTIAIAHRLSTVQDADLIIVLHRGEIVERGTHQELLALKGLYHKMYLLQQGMPDKAV